LAYWIFACSIGCGTDEPLTAKIVSSESTPISSDMSQDAEVAELIDPYLVEMHASMDATIGRAETTIGRNSPESPLGNLVADALLWNAQQVDDGVVDLSVVNNGGIRLPAIQEGDISVADIYQLIPFDNRIVVLTLTGEQVLALLRRLAEQRGEPMSGITYQISRDGSRVSNVRVDGKELIAGQGYRVATVDYLASIGGEFEIFGQASHRLDGDDYLRDAVIRYIQARETIRPLIDGRVSYEPEQ
jgi:2',3'-cyclic-nucleotide 2'-phosphodiesterase (5'-nucleotidase family)